MKRLIQLVTFLFLLYFGIQVLLVFVGNGHTIKYVLKDGDNSFSINEEYRSNNKVDSNNYLVNININNIEFNILTYEDFKKSSKIVESIKYYEDEQYKCIYAKYRNNKVLTDVICDNGSYKIAYHNMENPTDGLKNFIRELISNSDYSENIWEDNIFDKEESSSAILYTNNLINNHFIGLVANNSLYRFNSIEKIANVNLQVDLNSKIQTFTNEKYIYLNEEERIFNIYSITSSEKSDIKYDASINDPKLLGTYRDSIFIFDKNSEIEYEANTKTKKILEIGNSTTAIKYYANGSWQHKSLSDIDINNLNFGSLYAEDYNDPAYDKTIKVGNKYGYYYYYKNVGNGYQVYRSDIGHKDNKTYLFTTTNINSIQYIEGYIYYIENNSLKYYNDNKGNRTLIKINDINNNTLYKVFIDKTKEA